MGAPLSGHARECREAPARRDRQREQLAPHDAPRVSLGSVALPRQLLGYLGAQFRRIGKRRGPKRAAIAVAHSILVIAYHVLRDNVSFADLGADYFDRMNSTRARVTTCDDWRSWSATSAGSPRSRRSHRL